MPQMQPEAFKQSVFSSPDVVVCGSDVCLFSCVSYIFYECI